MHLQKSWDAFNVWAIWIQQTYYTSSVIQLTNFEENAIYFSHSSLQLIHPSFWIRGFQTHEDWNILRRTCWSTWGMARCEPTLWRARHLPVTIPITQRRTPWPPSIPRRCHSWIALRLYHTGRTDFALRMRPCSKTHTTFLCRHLRTWRVDLRCHKSPDTGMPKFHQSACFWVRLGRNSYRLGCMVLLNAPLWFGNIMI